MRQSNKKRHRKAEQSNLVTVALAGDITLAREYRKILLKYGIHSVVRTKPYGPMEVKYELLVRQRSFDRAYSVIEATNADDDFFSTIFEVEQPRHKAV